MGTTIKCDDDLHSALLKDGIAVRQKMQRYLQRRNCTYKSSCGICVVLVWYMRGGMLRKCTKHSNQTNSIPWGFLKQIEFHYFTRPYHRPPTITRAYWMGWDWWLSRISFSAPSEENVTLNHLGIHGGKFKEMWRETSTCISGLCCSQSANASPSQLDRGCNLKTKVNNLALYMQFSN